MLNKLNNTNSKTSNAYVNKQLQDLQNEVDELTIDVENAVQNIDTNTADINSIKEQLEDGLFSNDVDAENVKARDTVFTDKLASNTNDTIVSSSKLEAPEVDTTTVCTTNLVVNNRDFEEYIDDVNDAKSTANQTKQGLDLLEVVVENDKADLADFKVEVATNLNGENATFTGNVQTSSVSGNSACFTNQVSSSIETDIIKYRAGVYDGLLEPTVKGTNDFYQFHLPAKFNGRAKFIGIDNVGVQLFSVIIDTAFANSGSQDREGTALVIHSGVSKWDLYQVLRRKDRDQISFVTQSNIKKIYYQYESNKTDVPTYDIWTNLTDNGPDYTLYNTVYTAEHSDQVVVLGNEDTLNGGLTVFGTFYSTAFEVPETEVANVRVKHQIYGGYNCDTGEYETCGTPGGIITYNKRDTTDECNVSWINGCPRQIVRKGVCYDKDGYDNECSYLQFEDVKTKDTITGKFEPALTDSLFDEAALASYEGKTSVVSNLYPIKHLNADTCVHGNIAVEEDITVGCKVNTNNICSNTILNVNADTAVVTNTCCKIDNVTDSIECVSNGKIVNAVCYINNADNVAVNVTETLGITACCGTSITCGLTVDDLTITGKINGNNTNDGDFNVNGQLFVECDLSVSGDLYVSGQIVATSEKEINTSSDYITLRENVSCALGNNEKSGIAINNFQSGCIATLTVDNCGTFRISNSATSSSCSYTDISLYSGVYYDQLSQTEVTVIKGITQASEMKEIDDIVLDSNDEYYHQSGSDWYGPVTYSNSIFDVGSLVTDPTKIAELDALDLHDLVYYDALTITQIDDSVNQPLLTRSECSVLNNNDILVFDKTNVKAVSMVRPSNSNQILTSEIDPITNAVSYCWKNNTAGTVCRYSTIACANAALLIQEGCDGYVPDNALIVIDNETDYLVGEDR